MSNSVNEWPADKSHDGIRYRCYPSHTPSGPHIKYCKSRNGHGWRIWKKFKTVEELEAAWAEIPEDVEAEHLPPDSKSQSIGFLAEGEKPNYHLGGNLDTEELADQYHMVANRCAQLSVWCSAMAGAEILKKKKELGHGNGFTEWRNARPFSQSTASKYCKLAEKLEQKLNALPKAKLKKLMPAIGEAQESTENMLALLNLPSPMEVFNPQHEAISEIIRDITDGKSVTQLYFDWDICKPPRQLGGNPTLQKWLAEFHPRVKATRPEDLSKKLRKEYDAYIEELNAKAREELGENGENVYREQALEAWAKAQKPLHEFVRGRKLYAYLHTHEIKELGELLADYSHELKQAIKERSKQ